MAGFATWKGVMRIACAMLAFACASAAAERRVALLIGNNTYNVTPLHNAVNDARDLGAALKALGFTTIVRENATRREMIQAFREFGTAIERADAAVFFYAGHALQFKDRNYLLPIDSDIQSEEDIPAYAVEIQLVFDRMDRARTHQNIIILDACRDNPFAGTFKVSSPGLAQPVAPSGTLIAYATAPGAVAADGFGRNGLYTQHILEHIATPDLPVEALFKRVRAGVEKATARLQTPWDSSSLKDEFRFNDTSRGASAVSVAATPSAPSADVQLQIERDFWVTVKDSGSADELRAYLEHYPDGKFVSIARIRLQNLGNAPRREPPARSSRTGPQPGWRLMPAVFSAAPQAVPLQPPPPSLEDLFRVPQVADMQISPDGKRLAALYANGARSNAVVIDRATGKARQLTNMVTNDIVTVRWLSDNRLLLQTGSVVDRICHCRLGTLIAVDADGSNQRVLSEGLDSRDASRMTFRALVYLRPFPGEPDDYIAQEIVADLSGRASNGTLYRVNSRTGRKTQLTLGKPDSGEHESWVFDETGAPRVFSVRRRGEMVIYYRADANAAWEKIGQFRIGGEMWEPLAITRDGKAIYANSWRGRDKSAIVEVEPRLGGAEKLVASHPYVDVAELIFDHGVAVGIDYEADRHGFAWFDEELERMQSIADAALPRAVNRLSWSRDRSLVLVKSSSDVSPGAYYLFDRAAGKIQWLADTYPNLKPEALAPVRALRYRARDGLDIPSYLTLPRNKAPDAPSPLVVLVHDGPWGDAYHWRFNPVVQHLAAQGYAVLQPNFRGTLGFGAKHFRAGFKQWGRAMQDDLADGVRWAVAQGHADASRVCIAGEGYGGYAALMALATSPELFRCGAAFNGITDVVAYIDSAQSPLSQSDTAQYTLRELIGDPSAERALLAQVSPVHQAARIKAPVFLAAAEEYPLIPIDHSQRMRSALQANGTRTEWIVVAADPNGGPDVANARRLQEALAKFVGESIAKRN